jgi:hypothetical protein
MQNASILVPRPERRHRLVLRAYCLPRRFFARETNPTMVDRVAHPEDGEAYDGEGGMSCPSREAQQEPESFPGFVVLYLYRRRLQHAREYDRPTVRTQYKPRSGGRRHHALPHAKSVCDKVGDKVQSAKCPNSSAGQDARLYSRPEAWTEARCYENGASQLLFGT